MSDSELTYVRDLLFYDILRSLVALLSVKLLKLGIIQVNLILHSLTRNIVSVGMTGSRFDLAYIELTLKF